jgi:hypothetical protein
MPRSISPASRTLTGVNSTPSGGATDWMTANCPTRLLRARRERTSRRAAEQRDELPPPHSITSSARASSDGGTVRPSILAVWALMTSSNLLACTTGRSAGLAPLRMRPA